jgi:metallo-beta-lactamase class B
MTDLSRSVTKCLLGFVLLLYPRFATAQQAPPCPECATWNIPQAPFRLYGNTYYVGTHGLSSILITSASGHVLVDAALPESASQIVANIRSLGFRIEDVKLIVNSHVHFDHAGGIAQLQRLSGARVVASAWSAAVLNKGGIAPDDPQNGVIAGIAPVSNIETLHDGEVFRVGELQLTAHLTPGHTPGGTSWTWVSCEVNRCLNIVYADSLTAVSAEGFLFTKNPDAIRGFARSFAFLKATSCDILITTHPDSSELWGRLENRERHLSPDPMVDVSACRQLADRSSRQLAQRIALEKKDVARP